ncbi:hypothetical protein PV05_08668 [Exophiala xenobiotica]|uniref:Zn(2)-C6 fungal-type domain-containing protein n=1 Tax=Exophiala xenobiotica TaxID=348802 RepID=A0A0D2EEL2_9EURO|nr:uncharacterized protein PV05_08668 [Exophiala xenobiotica]KIW53070.1 hypothetical protein PV05_08668 [Exophiala xenobiotica]
MGHQRSSCDRCRGQKLRCPRNTQADDSEPCARCLRVGVQCVTSSSRPLGRPRTTGMAQRRTRSIRTRNTAPKVIHMGSTSPGLPSMTEGLEACFDLWTPTCLDAYRDHLPDASNLTTTDFENPALNSTFETNAECAFELQLPANDGLFEVEQLMEPPQRPQDDFSQLAIAKDHGQGPSSETSGPADTLTALSRLNEDIARQISSIDSYTWGPVNAPQHCLDQLHGTHRTPVAGMLETTSRFVTILENLHSLSSPSNESANKLVADLPSVSNSGIPDSNFEQRGTLPPIHPPFTDLRPLSTPVVLMLLSSYLLLLELYDAIFSRVHDTLSRLEDTRAFFQEIPGIQVAGLSSIKGHLYARIIIQIIEHHFDRLERLLGLPVEFGLSGQTPRSKGLLDTADLSHLLHVAMTQTTGDPGTSGRLTLKSFRDNLKYLEAMLPR